MGRMPNRAEDLSPAAERQRKSRGTDAITKGELLPVTHIPEADENWHPIAVDFYESLRTSGQSAWYQDSDWMYAYSLCDDLSYYKKSGNRSSMMLTAIMSAMSNLLVTEGDRRRVRIELTAPEPETEDAAVLAIADYKTSLGVDQ
jgi:hypothetical protein